MNVKTCTICLETKEWSEWYCRASGTPAGKLCKVCVKAKNRKRSMEPEIREKRLVSQKIYSNENREKLNGYLSDYYATKSGRAKSLIKSAKKRGETMGIDIDEDFVLGLMESDVCSVTGIKFDYQKPVGTKKNPYAPSLDRIDSTKGYYRDNVRLVIWQYNLMKGEITDEQLFNICKEIVNARGN